MTFQAHSPSPGVTDLLTDAAREIWGGSQHTLTLRFPANARLREATAPYGLALTEVFITDSDLRHIHRRHGSQEGDRSQLALTPEDVGLLPHLLSEFDSIEFSGRDKLGNARFLVKKKIETELYVATVQRGKSKLEIKTLWKKRC